MINKKQAIIKLPVDKLLAFILKALIPSRVANGSPVIIDDHRIGKNVNGKTMAARQNYPLMP